MSKLSDQYADRLHELLLQHEDPEEAMEYAERRFHEAGLTIAEGYAPRDDLSNFAHNLIRVNPLIPDYLRTARFRDPQNLESVEELVEELAAQSHD